MIPRAADRKRRLEASFEAGLAERRNRPTGLVAFAVLLLLAALLYLMFTTSARRAAASATRSAESSLQQLVNLGAQIDAYKDNDAQTELRRRYTPIMSTIRSRLERLAQDVGMTDQPPVLGQISAERRLGLDSPLLLRTIDATIAEGDPDLVLQWMQAATDEIDGLFVNGISLNPVTNGWRITVQLSRWEIDQ